METSMKRFIKLAEADKKWIEKAFGISRVMVNYALGFDPKHGRSALAGKIRNLALLRGGQVTLEVPECETIHDARGMMTQTFENGAKVEVNKKTGELEVKDAKGATVRRLKISMIEQLYAEQAFAAGL